MANKRVTYVKGSASILRLADGEKVLLEVVPGRLRLRTLGFLGRPGATHWEHRLPAEVREQTELAIKALDLALESIDKASTRSGALQQLNEVAAPELDLLTGPYETNAEDTLGKALEGTSRSDAAPNRPLAFVLLAGTLAGQCAGGALPDKPSVPTLAVLGLGITGTLLAFKGGEQRTILTLAVLCFLLILVQTVIDPLIGQRAAYGCSISAHSSS